MSETKAKPSKAEAKPNKEIDALKRAHKKEMDAMRKKLDGFVNTPTNTGAGKAHETTAKAEAVAINRAYVGGAPKVTRLPSGDIRVTHMEYIGDVVTTSGDFGLRQAGVLNWNLVTRLNPFGGPMPVGQAISQNAVNPANDSIFQVLRALAVNFEKYQFKKLEFIYGNRTSTAAVGEVMLGWDMDPDDSAPSSKAEFLQLKRVVSSSVHADCTLVVPKQACPLFVNQLVAGPVAAAPVGAPEPRTCNNGQFFIAGNNIDDGYCGDLYVRYDCMLMEYQNRPETQVSSAGFISQGAPVAGATRLLPFGTTVNQTSFSEGVGMGEYSSGIAGGTIQAVSIDKPGEYSVSGSIIGTGMSGNLNYVFLDPNDSANAENLSSVFSRTTVQLSSAAAVVRDIIVRITEAPVAIGFYLDAASTITNSFLTVAKMVVGSTTGAQTPVVVPLSLPFPPFFEFGEVDGKWVRRRVVKQKEEAKPVASVVVTETTRFITK